MGKTSKKLALCIKIRIHGPVIIQMISREVGEYSDLKGAIGGPILIEGMGGDLHDHIGDAFIGHFAQETHDIKGPARKAKRTPSSIGMIRKGPN